MKLLIESLGDINNCDKSTTVIYIYLVNQRYLNIIILIIINY